MNELIQIFEYPFMQRAALAGVVLGAVLAYLGVFVVLRRMAFFSDGIAHASLAGVAAGILAGVSPLGMALVTSVIFAIFMFYLEKKMRFSSDSVIGIIFTTGMALGVLLISRREGYQPDLISFLFGNILAIHPDEMLLILAGSAATGFFLVTQSRRLTLVSVDPEMAHVSGFKPARLELLLHIVLAISVVLGIKILGIVLVSALLILPVSIAKLISRSFQNLIITSVLISEVIVIGGLLISYIFDLPTGAVIVLAGSGLFFFTLLIRPLWAARSR